LFSTALREVRKIWFYASRCFSVCLFDYLFLVSYCVQNKKNVYVYKNAKQKTHTQNKPAKIIDKSKFLRPALGIRIIRWKSFKRTLKKNSVLFKMLFCAARSDEHKAQLFLVSAAFEKPHHIYNIVVEIRRALYMLHFIIYYNIISPNTSFIVFCAMFVRNYYFRRYLILYVCNCFRYHTW